MKNIKIENKDSLILLFFLQMPKGIGQHTFTVPAETSHSRTIINDVSS